ncbi:hypothetical protein SUGI_0311940 [Cryptomeria japonica]|nr:hypothetical protein SUGI_0311940 [Cryptomeria japonica]
MGTAYSVGMGLIVLVGVPDWAFFMRPPAQWFTHLPIADNNGGQMGCNVNVVLEEEKKCPHQREGVSADGAPIQT